VVSNAANIEERVNQVKRKGGTSVPLLVSNADGKQRSVLLRLPNERAPAPNKNEYQEKLARELAEQQRKMKEEDRQHREIVERNRVEAERKYQDQLAARDERERQRRAGLEQEAKFPFSRLRRAYGAYAIVQLCHQIREGYLATDINDVELQRAQAAAKAIEKAEIAKDPTIDPDKLFAEADNVARRKFSGVYEGHRRTYCRSALSELLSKSPVSPYRTQRP